MQDLRVAFIQSDLFWEDHQRNLERFNLLIDSVDGPVDLILLPETFNTGFSINPEICAEDLHGPSMQFLRKKAEQKQVVIMATLIIRDDGGHYNRLVCVYPDGRFSTYDKRHLFRMSDELRLFRKGNQRVVFDILGWRVAPQICYDLRFPVWSRNTYRDGRYAYDLLVYLSNWPASRANLWKILLPARAIENQAFVIGVNRIGRDGHETRHSGDSRAIDPKGNILAEAPEDRDYIGYVTLSAGELAAFRESFTVGLDWDRFTLHTKRK